MTSDSVYKNAAAARSFVEALLAGAGGDAKALLAPDATWWISGTLPFSGTFSIAELFAGSAQMFAEATGPRTGGIGAITAQDDRVAVESWVRRELGDGRVYHNEVHMLMTFRDGLIVAIKEYGDTDLLRRLFGNLVIELPTRTLGQRQETLDQ